MSAELERIDVASLTLASSSSLTHPKTSADEEFSLTINATGKLSLDETSVIEVSGLG